MPRFGLQEIIQRGVFVKGALGGRFALSAKHLLDWRGEGLAWIALDKSGFLLYF